MHRYQPSDDEVEVFSKFKGKKEELPESDRFIFEVQFVMSLFVGDTHIEYLYTLRTALFLDRIVVDESTSAVQTVGPAIDHEELPRGI